MSQLFAHHFSARRVPSVRAGSSGAVAGESHATGGCLPRSCSQQEAMGDSFPHVLLSGEYRLARGGQ